MSDAPIPRHESTVRVGLDNLNAEVSRSNLEHTTHPVGRSVAETLPYNTQQSQTTGLHTRGGIRAPNPSKRTA
jgi:hypothetical protein